MRALLDQRIADLADRQHGVVDTADLAGLGASPDQVLRRERAGRLIRLYRGVYAVGHRRLTLEGGGSRPSRRAGRAPC